MSEIIKMPTLRFPNFNGAWMKSKIGDITHKYVNPVDVNADFYYQEIGIRSHGKGIFHKEPILGKELGNKRVFRIKENAFIVNIVFAWEQAIGKTTEKEIGMIASHRFPMYLPKENRISIDFLLHFFLTRKGKSLLELASPGGAGRNKTLGQKEFENLVLSIPSLPEQQKIADFLTSIDKRIQLLKEKKDALGSYKKGVMQKLFSQEIRFKDENGNNYSDWKEKRLGKIGDSYNGLTGKSVENFGQGKKYIQYKQIFDNSKIILSKCGLVDVSDSENQNKVQFGDIFFTTSSETPQEVGFSSVLLEEVIEDIYLNSFSFGFRPHNLNELNPYFARYLFRSEEVRAKIMKLAQGSTRYNMSKTEFLKISVFLPSYYEQQKMANVLFVIDTKISICEEQITQSEEYKKGLLQQMFV